MQLIALALAFLGLAIPLLIFYYLNRRNENRKQLPSKERVSK